MRARAILSSTLGAIAFAVAAFAAVAIALLPAQLQPTDLNKVLITAPPGDWAPAPVLDEPLDRGRLVELGASAERARLLTDGVRGHVRTWTSQSRGAVIFAAVFEDRWHRGAAQSLSGFLGGSTRGWTAFDVPGVDGARGFVGDAKGGAVVTQAVLRRGTLVFVFGVQAGRAEPAMVGALAAAQSAQAPAGDSEPYDRAHAAGAGIGAVLGGLGLYLLLLNLRRPGRRRSRPRADARPGAPAVDVTATVRSRRRVARGTFAVKAVGWCMVVPVLAPVAWPWSLATAIPGIALLAGAIAFQRRRHTGPRPAGRGRYRRLFTGRRTARVIGLLAVAALLVAVAALALTTALLDGERDEAGRQAFGALACLGLAVLPYRRARRHAALDADAVTAGDARDPILYLRSFGDDRRTIRARGGARRHSGLERFGYRRRERFEEVIAGCLWAYGPVIAVSAPGEKLAPIGAARTQCDDAAWQPCVERLLGGAGLVVIAVGHSAGLVWEVKRITELGLWPRTIFVFPPLAAAELEERWQAVTAATAAAGAGLPDDVRPDRTLVARVVGGALVGYEGSARDEWNYEAALDAAAAAPIDADRAAVAA